MQLVVPVVQVKGNVIKSGNFGPEHPDGGRTGALQSLLSRKILRVQVPNMQVLGIWVIVILVQVLGKYMIIGYLDR